MPKKLYCFVDESGQDTKGHFFVVAIVVVSEHREAAEQALLICERESSKGRIKWRKADHRYRMKYIRTVLRLPEHDSLFFSTGSGKEYELMTGRAVVDAAMASLAGQVDQSKAELVAVIDGLKRSEQPRMRQILSRLWKGRVAVSGIRDESSAFVRLADALAGLIHDAEDGNPESALLVEQAIRRGILTRL